MLTPRTFSPLVALSLVVVLAGCTTPKPAGTSRAEPPAAAAGPAATAQVRLGNEVLALHGFRELAGKRVGLITNPSGVNRNLETTIEVLRRAPGVKLVALFGPEHGVYGDVPAGEQVKGGVDPRTGITVHSLYGATHRPTREMLAGLDAVVYDLQDTGCRSYTFISTMGDAMDACGEAGVEFVVLDRPNPLGGERIEGSGVEEKFRSGVSRWDIPYVYGLTCGELARMINDRGWIKHPCKLTVVPLEGWRRDMTWTDTGLPWVPTSPHVPHAFSPLFLVATGMLGETPVVNIGVGYTLPFQCIGLPKLDAHAFAARMNAFGLPGVHFQPLTFQPFYGTAKGTILGGAQLYFTDAAHAPLTAINYYAIEALKETAGFDLFAETAKTNAQRLQMWDKVNGSDAPRRRMEAGAHAADIVASWKAAEDEFRQARAKYLLY
ncbi:DUF1343 domain-containing protein [Opitutus sp. ER46]|uniref:exo-beta-N-acetylmuramidase NamZ family protein n=1 Tax=Opitutus sp. ER46 TaxID=2161864 RepID=UPI000D321464|nr:DUF1343 domain-containing protein [Opitutus sp. ER46]PTX90997.1 DUF1343 domain-containing protein [Opitutus sp. ER46]